MPERQEVRREARHVGHAAQGKAAVKLQASPTTNVCQSQVSQGKGRRREAHERWHVNTVCVSLPSKARPCLSISKGMCVAQGHKHKGVKKGERVMCC